MEIKPLLGLGGVLIAAMGTELNDQVTSIGIAEIRGGLNISFDPGTWMESLYISAEIIGMATGPWLMVTFTLRRFILFVMTLCCVSSMLIPFSPDIFGIYVLRVLQGLSGGLTIPLLMATALRVLTPDIRLYGLAVYALTATFTPAIAAPFAALWTNIVGWRFAFFQAIPFCTLAALLSWYGLPQDKADYQRFRMLDWRGLLLLIIGFGALSTMLFQGDRLDWFNSKLICVLALASVVAVPLLLANEWFHPLPLFKLQLLGRPNFGYGAIALFLFLLIGQSASTVPLQFLTQVQGFLPLQSEIITLVIAASQLVMLPAMALLLDYRRVDSRVVSFIGLMLIIASCIGSSFVTVYWDTTQFLLWQILQAVGQPMVVMPLLLMATNSVVPQEGPFASGLVNAPRALSEATGIWLLDLITRWRGGLHSDRIIDQLGQDRWRVAVPGGPAALNQAVRQQVTILTLSDAYLVMAAIAAALTVVLLVLPVRTLPPRIQLADH
ncbi:MFS transporter [Rhodopila sp.]|uniref:MFS transporter n=1 Tax=Rhodopila sp. TaxID=2480087 RepID=UPI003D1002DC